MIRGLKVAGVAAVGVFALPAIAAAQSMAVATTDLNMRAGPSPQHQVVAVIPANQGVAIHDCTASMNWCQVSYGGATGWSYTPYLADTGQVAYGAAGAPAAPDVPQRQAGAPVAGIAGGALAGGLIGGPPGAIIGAGTGALLGGAAARPAHGTVAVAGPAPHAAPVHRTGHLAPGVGIAGGALAGGLIGGPPGAIIGGFTGGALAAGAASGPRYYPHQ